MKTGHYKETEPDLGVSKTSVAAKRLTETLCHRIASHMQEIMWSPSETMAIWHQHIAMNDNVSLVEQIEENQGQV